MHESLASNRRHPRRLASLAALLVGLSIVVGACGAPPESGPGPSAPCAGQDGYAAGYYPPLEGLLPATWQGQAPKHVQSGRYCSPNALGPLQSAGIAEVHYAGSIWVASDNESSMTMLTYQAPGLTAARLADNFEQAARNTSGLQSLSRRDVTVDGRPGFRLDAVLESSRESRIVWPSSDGQRVNAIIASGVTEDALSSAEAAFSS